MGIADKIKRIFKGSSYENDQVYKGWHAPRQRAGWIARPFQGQEVFLGENGDDATEAARDMVDYEEEQRP